MERLPRKFRTKHHASFQVLDPFGHMNTVQYLTFFLEHRFDALRDLGLDLAAIARLPFVFVTRRADVTYQKPIVGDEAFTITSSVLSFGDIDCHVRCEMQKGDGSVAATCDLTLVCVAKETRRPAPWNPEFVARFYE